MAGILALLWIAASVCFCIATFKPTFFHRFGTTFPRKHLLASFGIASVVLFFSFGAIAPPPSSPASSQTQQTAQKTPDQHTTKQISDTKPVAFTTQNVNDSSLAKGQTQIQQAGKNGVETIAYQVNYTNGKETSRTQLSDSITTPAVPQIVEQGTYVAPAPSSSSSGLSNNNTYTNSSGNTVHSPANSTDGSVPAGATARCNDGTYSFSQHHSGTCSSHGGVASWL